MKMNKKSFSFISLFILIITSIAFAEFHPTKVFSLSDGATLKGKLIGVRERDGAYLIETPDLGTVAVQSQNVVQMTNENTAKSQFSQQPQLKDSNFQLQDSINAPAIQELKTMMMSDPNIMASLQELLSDPEMLKIFQDPQLMQDIMSMDPNTIQSNPNVQRLLESPIMQQLIQKTQQKMTGQSQGFSP